MTIPGGIYNYTSFTIFPGVNVQVSGNVPLEIYCQGSVIVNGTLHVDGGNGTNGITSSSAGVGGFGVAGGGNGGNGSYSVSIGGVPGIDGANTGGVGNGGGGWSGGGGAGYATTGQASGAATGGFAGVAYGTPNLSIVTSGSGGGGGSGGLSCGSGGGGAGGGIILIHANSVEIGASGMISSIGGFGGTDGAGNCGGGGGGSGGTLWIEAATLLNNGLISAIGGTGGGSEVPGTPYFGDGGDGADGRIRIDAVVSGSGSTDPSVGFSGPVPNVAVQISQTLSICNADSLNVGSNYYSSTGIYIDTLQTVAGCDSIVETDLTVLPLNESTQSFNICEGDSVVVGTSSYNTTGTYTDVLMAMSGCDSTVVTTVNVDIIDVAVTNTVNVLTASSSVGTYQWLDCDNNNFPITGETSQVFSPTAIGNYAVEITVGNCIDTSACVLVDFASLDENSTSFLSLYPNPSNGVVYLKGIEKIAGFELLEIYTASGQKVASYDELNESYDLSKLNNGIYFMEFQLTDRTETIRLIKQ